MPYLWLLWQTYGPTCRREEGQGLIEYALILVLVAILLIVALLAVKDQLSGNFSTIQSGLQRTS